QLMLILDVRTRWTSTTRCSVSRALHNKDVINRYIRDTSDLADAQLSEAGWTALHQVPSWLSDFRHTTTEMSTTSKPMLLKTHLVFCGLQASVKEKLTELPTNVAPELKEGLVATHKKLSDYYFVFDASPYYLWASLLDPRIGYATLADIFKDESDLLIDLEQAKKSLKKEYTDLYIPKAATPSPKTQPSGPTARIPTRDTRCPLYSWCVILIFFFSFWLLTLQSGSAVAVERVFWGGRDTIALRRASLQPSTIRTLMVLKVQLRLAHKEVIDALDEADTIGLGK
ncbi:hypothetical protein DFH07DRAFT_757185, partial [Mycena maculata]